MSAGLCRTGRRGRRCEATGCGGPAGGSPSAGRGLRLGRSEVWGTGWGGKATGRLRRGDGRRETTGRWRGCEPGRLGWSEATGRAWRREPTRCGRCSKLLLLGRGEPRRCRWGAVTGRSPVGQLLLRGREAGRSGRGTGEGRLVHVVLFCVLRLMGREGHRHGRPGSCLRVLIEEEELTVDLLRFLGDWKCNKSLFVGFVVLEEVDL